MSYEPVDPRDEVDYCYESSIPSTGCSAALIMLFFVLLIVLAIWG